MNANGQSNFCRTILRRLFLESPCLACYIFPLRCDPNLQSLRKSSSGAKTLVDTKLSSQQRQNEPIAPAGQRTSGRFSKVLVKRLEAVVELECKKIQESICYVQHRKRIPVSLGRRSTFLLRSPAYTQHTCWCSIILQQMGSTAVFCLAVWCKRRSVRHQIQLSN